MDNANVEISVTTFEAADKLDIERPRLREWLSRKYIEPAVPSTGRGSKAYLDLVNLYQLKLFATLVNRGYSRDRAAHAVKSIRNGEPLKLWDKTMPLFLSLYETEDGWQGESVFASMEYTVKTISEHGELIEHTAINLGKIVKKVDGIFLV